MENLKVFYFMRNMFFVFSIFLSTNLMAYDFEADGIFYNILSDEDHTLSVTGGDRNDNIPYNFYYTGIVKIPAMVPFHGHDYTVVAIDDEAFITCINVSYVVLPSTLKHIGKKAFLLCQGLSSISLPEGLISIDDEAFSSCEKLESIVLPQSLTEIGKRPFAECNKLNVTVSDNNPLFSIRQNLLYNTSHKELVMSLPQASGDVVIPEDVESIRAYAFCDSKNIRSVTVNEGITKIEDYTFAYSKIQRVSLPVSVVDIGNSSFSGCSYLYDITIQGQVKTIGDYAFQYCSNLPLIDLPSSILSIGRYAFRECNRLKKLSLPESLTVIGYRAFENCIALESFNFPKTLREICSGAFIGCNFPTIEIDDNITEIGDSAFMFAWTGSSTIALTIKGNSIKHIGKYAFYTEHNKNIKIYSDIPPLIEEMSFASYWGNPYEHTTVYPMIVHVKKGLYATYKESEGWDIYTIIDDLDGGEPAAIMDKASYSIKIGDIGQASVTVQPDVITNVSIKWRTDKEDILFVDPNTGQFIGLKEGEASIYADVTAMYAGEQITLSAKAAVIVTGTNAILNVSSLSDEKGIMFNLDGTKAKHQKRGIQIVRMSDGSIKKVMSNKRYY